MYAFKGVFIHSVKQRLIIFTMNRFGTLVTFILLTGCGPGNYDFETIAMYQADSSNLQVNLITTGHVLTGADIGDGKARGIITSTEFADTIYFQTNSTKLTVLNYKKGEIELTGSTDFSITLMDCLNKIGNIEYDTQEIIEFGKVITATTYGPKGTYLEGQTDLVRVIIVEINTE
jgi:hypothetical protein